MGMWKVELVIHICKLLGLRLIDAAGIVSALQIITGICYFIFLILIHFDYPFRFNIKVAFDDFIFKIEVSTMFFKYTEVKL